MSDAVAYRRRGVDREIVLAARAVINARELYPVRCKLQAALRQAILEDMQARGYNVWQQAYQLWPWDLWKHDPL